MNEIGHTCVELYRVCLFRQLCPDYGRLIPVVECGFCARCFEKANVVAFAASTKVIAMTYVKSLPYLARFMLVIGVLLSPLATLPMFGALPLDTIFLTPLFAAVSVVAWPFCLLAVRTFWRRSHRRALTPSARLNTMMTSALIAVCFPFALLQIGVWQKAYGRVPEPLKGAAIEFRNEKAWGAGGLPGDNETGFIVLRLTSSSSAWARKEGAGLASKLPGGTNRWRQTPIDFSNGDWPLEQGGQTSKGWLNRYLEKYGFNIDVPKGWRDKFDRAAESPGSFYRYGGGGSLTLVDPANGLTFFAYAG